MAHLPHKQYQAHTVTAKPQRRHFLLVSCLTFIAIFGIYTILALLKPLPALTVSLQTVRHAPENIVLTWPKSGQAAIGSTTDGLLQSSPAQVQSPRAIASVTKIITALSILNKYPLKNNEQGPLITITAEDQASYETYNNQGGSTVRVSEGEQLSERQALEGLLLPSGNNMADTLAVWGFGSIDGYLSYASDLIKSYGLKNTIVADASGFADTTLSTANDLVILAQKVMANETLRSIVGERSADIPEAGTILNTNRLLQVENVLGIKTGNTDAAGGCLLFAAKQNNATSENDIIIGAIVGAPSLNIAFEDAAALLSTANLYGFGHYSVIEANQAVGTISSAWGQNATVIAREGVNATGWKGKEVVAAPQADKIGPIVSKSQKVGTIAFKNKGLTTSAQLIADRAITKPSILWRLTHYF